MFSLSDVPTLTIHSPCEAISSQYILDGLWLCFDCSEQSEAVTIFIEISLLGSLFATCCFVPSLFWVASCFRFAYCKYCAAASNHLLTVLWRTICSSRREVGGRDQRVKLVQN